MLLDEVKATLAMENLTLNEEQEKLLEQYAEGKCSFEQFQELIVKLSSSICVIYTFLPFSLIEFLLYQQHHHWH